MENNKFSFWAGLIIMKLLEDFTELELAKMRRCLACFAILMYDLPEWKTQILPHAALCSDNPLLTEEESDELT